MSGRGVRSTWARSTAAAALLALLLMPSAVQGFAGASADDGFVPRDVPLETGRLFDLGVSDYDRDGRQELFSTNHKFLGTFTETDLAGGWRDLMASTGFSPNPAYPGFEDLLHEPVIDRPGLYIYAVASGRSGADPEKNPTLHIVANDIAGIPLLPERAEGTLTLRSDRVQVVRKEGATVGVAKRGLRTRIDFSVAEQGHIAIKVFKADLPPFDFQIDQAPVLARTYIGADRVPAQGSSFELRLIDRHGVAWTDADRDGLVDAFVVRGGLGGGIVDFVGEVFDELLLAQPSGEFRNGYLGSGLVKGACRSRLTTSVDYDADGLLDLFSSCKAGTPKLYRALPSGEYGSRSKALAQVPSQGTYYRWIDLLGDRRPELVVANKGEVTVLTSRGLRRWRVAETVPAFNRTKLVYSIAPGDPDRDGDSDLFVGSNSGNTLLVNEGDGTLDAVRPASVGLPDKGSGASWVDFDNDGRLDLHSVPSGLFRQRRDGSFDRTGFVRNRLDSVWGIANWFDADNDGYRDVVTAVRRPGGEADVDGRLELNARNGNRWLEIDLDGEPGNPQGVGARVAVKTGAGVQTGWVGEADGARFSHGHYRLYFGLGGAAVADRVTVGWPDGERTVLHDVGADRRLVISP
jgi:hypothetical protein